MKSTIQALAAGALIAAASSALAAEPSVQGMQRINGVVSAMAPGEATLAAADGKSVKVHLTAATHLMLSQPVDPSVIKEGDYIGTTNMDQADGSGVSSEVHVFSGPSPGTKINVPWGGGAMMTNGPVTKVAKGAAGPQIEVDYGGAGAKKVMVPSKTPVVMLTATSDMSLIKVGAKLLVAGAAAEDGGVNAAYITVSVPAAKP